MHPPIQSEWLTHAGRFYLTKKKNKKIKNFTQEKLYQKYEWEIPKVMVNLKNGIFSNFIQEIKKKSITKFTRVDFKLLNREIFQSFIREIFQITTHNSVL